MLELVGLLAFIEFPGLTVKTQLTQRNQLTQKAQIMKIKTFEDILAWQEARKLVKMIYQATENSTIGHDFRFKTQIQSASISVMSNIAEGFSRNSNKEFNRFLFIAKGSLAELQSQLYAAKDLDYISSAEFTDIYNQADKTARLISRFISYLRNPNNQLTQQTQ